MRANIKYLILLFMILTIGKADAQEWLRNEIETFQVEDETEGITEGKILFIGSSTIRMWDSFYEDFPFVSALKRGFGGSSLRDAIYYFEDIVRPYRPSHIILYFGDNDLANDYYSVEMYMRDVECFVRMTEIILPGTPLTFISIKPSPSRREYFTKFTEANSMLKNLNKKYGNISYIDIWTPMADENDSLRDTSVFTADSLHMSAAGYELWKNIITPYIKN